MPFTPLLTVTRRAADNLRAGQVWVYRTELSAPGEAATLPPGSLVTLVDSRQLPLGSAIYSSASQIAARLVSRAPGLTRDDWLEELRTRLRTALLRRQPIGDSSTGDSSTGDSSTGSSGNGSSGGDSSTVPHAGDAQRLVFSEADDLPGIIIDRYASLVLVQLLTQGTAQDDVRKAVTDELRLFLSPHGEPLTVWERPDPRVRELEELAPPPAGPLYTTAPGTEQAPHTTDFQLNGLRFGYDAGAGQKTGAFLDQRLNYEFAAQAVAASGRTGRALDVCTYHGGFALHLARVCRHVTGVDASLAALTVADANAQRNAGLPGRLDWVQADAFALLRALDDANRPEAAGTTPADLPLEPGSFDAIVLDPPAFAKSKRAQEGALRGYKELNLRALRLLAPGGTLITCSCSHHVSLAHFTEMLASAAADAGRRVQLLAIHGAAPDHPEIVTLPATAYLKCLIVRVE